MSISTFKKFNNESGFSTSVEILAENSDFLQYWVLREDRTPLFDGWVLSFNIDRLLHDDINISVKRDQLHSFSTVKRIIANPNSFNYTVIQTSNSSFEVKRLDSIEEFVIEANNDLVLHLKDFSIIW